MFQRRSLFITWISVFSHLWIGDLAGAEDREYRGFYVTAFSSGAKSPGEIDRLIADVSAARANLLIVQVGRRGDAYYNKSFQPRTEDPALGADFDALQYIIDKAHATSPRIEVHAWLSTCAIWNTSLGTAPANPDHGFNRHGLSRSGRENWLTRRVDGTTIAGSDYWLDPAHPAAVDYVVRMYSYLVANYDVDGIHLDRVRYPEIQYRNALIPEWGYNETAVERFNTKHSRAGTPAPDDPDWVNFRREALRGLVRKIYLVCTAINPNLKISASTVAFGAGPATDAEYEQTRTYKQVLQDPVGWLREGILDANLPLNYDRETDSSQRTWFEDWLRFEKDRASGRHVIPATALYLNTVTNSILQFRKVLTPNSSGGSAAGVAGFSYQSPSSDGRTFADLARALTQPSVFDLQGPLFGSAVETPEATWKKNPTTGSLMGWATSASGSLLDGAEVEIQGPESRTVSCDGSGWFGALGLQPGTYTATISGIAARGDVQVDAGAVASVHLQEGQGAFALVYPRVETDAERFSGFALSNVGNGIESVRFDLYGPDGVAAATSSLALGPGEQVARLATQIFSATLLPRGAWISVTRTSAAVTGLFQAGDRSGNELDGGTGCPRTTSRLFFGRLFQGDVPRYGKTSTEFILINPGPAVVDVRCLLRAANGKILDRAGMALNARASKSFLLDDLFSSAAIRDGMGFLEVHAGGEICGYEWITVQGSAMGLIADWPVATTRLAAAQFASGGIGGIRYFTEFNLVSASDVDQPVTFLLHTDTGQPEVSGPVTRVLPARGQLRVRGENVFGLSDPATSSSLVQGAVSMTFTQPSRILGDVTFGSPTDLRFLASLPLSPSGQDDVVFNHVANGTVGKLGYFTGIGIFNPSATGADLDIEVYRSDRQKAGSTRLSLGAGARLARLIDQLVPESQNQVGGYVRVKSSKELVMFQLFGDRSLQFLSAIPPQSIP